MAGLGLPPVHWSCSGQPVVLADWSANSSAGAGFDQMRGVITAADARIMPQTIMQGSIISGWSEYGRVVFEGRLASAPKIAQDGTASIVAQGRISEARKRQSRLLFYTAKATVLKGPGSGNPQTTVTLEDNEDPITSYRDVEGKGTITVTSSVGANPVNVMLYIPDGRIRRVKGRINNLGGSGLLLIQVAESQFAPPVTVAEFGPWGAFVDEDFDVKIPGPGASVIVLGFTDATATNPSGFINGFELWGEQYGEIIYSEQAASSIATRLEWDDSGVQAVGGTDIRPMDWQGPWDEMIAYVASLDGACWGVYEDERGYGPRLDYGAWGRRTWQVSSAGATWDLQPLEIINRVNVAYVTPDGRDDQIVLDAVPDPLDAMGIVTEQKLSMNDRQSDLDLVTRYATSTLAYVSTQRYSGRISCVSATDTKTGLDAPYEIRGGDMVTIADFNGSDPLTVRIADVEYGPNMVTIGVEEAAVPLGGGNAAGVNARPVTVDPSIQQQPPAAPVQARTSAPSVSTYNPTGGLRWKHNYPH